MRRKRRTHSPEFKSKVALAAIKGDLTMVELVSKRSNETVIDPRAPHLISWDPAQVTGHSRPLFPTH
jgi:hypothetical protein